MPCNELRVFHRARLRTSSLLLLLWALRKSTGKPRIRVHGEITFRLCGASAVCVLSEIPNLRVSTGSLETGGVASSCDKR